MKTVIAYILAYFRPDIAKILGGFDKLQASIEKYANRATKDLENIQTAIDAAVNARDAKNADLDRAYRTLHRLSELVK